MRCVFCKQCSDDSVSIEHIIPESLGNTKTILPIGAVCDSCNNYFSSKVEKHVSESDEFKYLRSHQVIKNKKRKFQEVEVLVNGQPVRTRRTDKLTFAVNEDDFTKVKEALTSEPNSEIMLPVTGKPPSDHHLSRFLAKMAIETLASRWVNTDGWNDYLVDHEGFDPIRKFSRQPLRGETWEYSKRRIYEQDSPHVKHQVIYESDILVIGTPEAAEFYFVVAFFGMEYAINIGGSSMDGYKKWLSENDDISPLFKKG
jgi:hypothetical protein